MKSAKIFFTVLTLTLVGFAAPALAVDGCKVLLCLAGPWQSIPACASEVEDLFQSLRKGDPFPSCSFANGRVYAPGTPGSGGAGAAASRNVWLGQGMLEPDPDCPPQFVTAFDLMGATRYGCRYIGMVTVYVDGMPWARTYWNMHGRSVTELSSYAAAAGKQASGSGHTELPR